MSQEQPLIRNRRELRKPRAERPGANREPGTPGPGAFTPASNGPGTAGPATPGPDGVVASGVVDPGEPTEAEVTGRRRYSGPVDSVRTAAGSGPPPHGRARDSATLRTIRELAEKEANLSAGVPPTRRQLRLLQLAAAAAAAAPAPLNVPASPGTPDAAGGAAAGAQPAADRAPADGAETPGQKGDGGTAGRGGQGPSGMTVEQALAARDLLAQQAKNQLAKMEHISATAPGAVDPDGLSGQDALSARSAVLNRPAGAGKNPAEQGSKPEPVRNDPATAHNLAMVTPLEFVRVPGVERPVMKRPPTTHVPVVTTSGPRIEQPRKSGNRRPGPSRPEAGVPAVPQPDKAFDGRPPVAANTAYGLEPLDADTAGLGRARRLRLVQLAVLALGVMALIAGGMLIITGLPG